MSRNASIGKILGPSFSQDEIPNIINKILTVYVKERQEEEIFIDTYQRIGIKPFKEFVYG